MATWAHAHGAAATQWALSECATCMCVSLCVCGVIEELSTNYGFIMGTASAQSRSPTGRPLPTPFLLHPAQPKVLCDAAKVVHFINCCNLWAWRHAASSDCVWHFNWFAVALKKERKREKTPNPKSVWKRSWKGCKNRHDMACNCKCSSTNAIYPMKFCQK